MAWTKRQQMGFVGFLLWVFGVGLTASLTFETGAPVPIFAAVSIWIGTWLNTRSNYMDASDTADQSQNADD